MSGICGVVQLDGAPAPPRVLDSLVGRLRDRGPDGSGSVIRGCAGLGKTLFATTPEAASESGPCTDDGRLWIVADARIDGRETLSAELRAAGRTLAHGVTDERLILEAYAAWGDDCLAHLLGDFAFAIWDAPRRRLFCARDPIGVKPFFHARAGRTLHFASSLPALRACHGVSAALRPRAITDFLLFGESLEADTTTFEGIARLPPAHCLVADGEAVSIRRYWDLPATEVVYRDPADYVDRFAELLDAAVSDRMRGARLGILMSGGLDSTAIAARARVLSPSCSIRAHSQDWGRMFPDDERTYATLAAERLAIPVDFQDSGAYGLYDRHSSFECLFPEPAHAPFAATDVDLANAAAAHSRVALTGWDGDTLLSEPPRPYFDALLRKGRLARLAMEAAGYLWAERRIPRLVPARAGERETSPLPAWIRPGVARQHRLMERIAERREQPLRAGIRPHATRALRYLMSLSNFFDACDPMLTGARVEYRHPFLDRRLVEFCLSLPPYPWCRRKEILRRAIGDSLPPEVVRRPKTPLAGFPHMHALRDGRSRWVDSFEPCGLLADYVERAKIPSVCGESDPQAAWRNLRPLSLDLWLRHAATANLH